MIQEGQLLCDGCKAPISLEGKLALQVLIEITQESPDRHYCEECSSEAGKTASAIEGSPKHGT